MAQLKIASAWGNLSVLQVL